MSYQAVQWAMDDAPMLRMPKSGLPDTTARAVLIARAERAGEDGTDTHAGIEDVIWRTGFDESTIFRAQQRLEAAGLMVRDGVTHWGTPRWNLDLTMRRDPAELAQIQEEAARKRAKHADRERARRAAKAADSSKRADAKSARAGSASARADLNVARADAVRPEPPMNLPNLPGTSLGGTLPPDPLRHEPPTGSRNEQDPPLYAGQDQPLEAAVTSLTRTREDHTVPLPTTTTVASPTTLCAHGVDTRRTTKDGQPRCKPCRTEPAAAIDTTSTPAPGTCGTPGCARGYLLLGEVLTRCTTCPTPVEPAAPRQPRGPAPDDQVWIAVPRRGVTGHQPLTAEPYTRCRRPMRTGSHLTAATATQRHQALWCPDCWPHTTEQP